jgi:hypothetical protein
LYKIPSIVGCILQSCEIEHTFISFKPEKNTASLLGLIGKPKEVILGFDLAQGLEMNSYEHGHKCKYFD